MERSDIYFSSMSSICGNVLCILKEGVQTFLGKKLGNFFPNNVVKNVGNTVTII